MPHYTSYKCSECGKECEREVLVAKKVTFCVIGPGGKVIKSRTIGWLCDICIGKDEHWNMEPYTSSPGLKSEPLERVRSAERRSGRVI